MLPLGRFATFVFVGWSVQVGAQTNDTNVTYPWNTNYVDWNNTWTWIPWVAPNRPSWLPTYWENWWYNYWYDAPNQTNVGTYWDTFDTTATVLTDSFDEMYFGSEDNGLTAIKITSNHYRQKKTLKEGEWLAFLTPVLRPPVSIRLTVQLQGNLISKSTRTVAECIQYDKGGIGILTPGTFPCKVNSTDDSLYNDCVEGQSSCDLLIEEGDWNGRSVISQHLLSIPDCTLPDWYNNSCITQTDKNSSAWRTYRDCSQVFGPTNCQQLLPPDDESCGGYPQPRSWVLGLYLDTCAACIGETADVEIDIYLSHQQFPWKEAEIALNLSFAAYTSDRSELTGWTCELCSPKLQNVTVVTAGAGDSTLAYIGFDPDTRLIYVVFRGTTDISSQTDTSFVNWATNLNSVKTTWKGCQVHKGFHSAWTSVNPDLLTQLYKLMAVHRQADIRVVGHSLGGALATLFAMNLKSLTWPEAGVNRSDVVPLAQRKIQIITFGQPRVGDDCFAGEFAAAGLDLWRVVNNADGVPTLPSRSSGFQHVGTEIFFYQPGTSQYMVCFNNKTTEDEECRLSVTAPSINDHLTYMNRSLKAPENFTTFEQVSPPPSLVLLITGSRCQKASSLDGLPTSLFSLSFPSPCPTCSRPNVNPSQSGSATRRAPTRVRSPG
jgi:hypothetical protein